MIGLLNSQLLSDPLQRQFGLLFALGLFLALAWWSFGMQKLDKIERSSEDGEPQQSNS